MKKPNLSLIIITKNCSQTLERTLRSVVDLVDEIILVDDHSTDQTLAIAKQYHAKIFDYSGSFGQRKLFALKKADGNWILNLDSDEVLSKKLKTEIRVILKNPSASAYYLPYQNYCFDRPLLHGGEKYQMLRFFKKEAAIINNNLIHEHFELKAGYQVGKLRNNILHYSYRSLPQIYSKFTQYALLLANEKTRKNEKTGLKKIFLYPIHMFWARFFKDKGYQDGFIVRLPLDLGFAYMEFLTYFLMLFPKKI